MKKNYLILLVFGLFSSLTFSQPDTLKNDEDKRDSIFKLSFILENNIFPSTLSLTAGVNIQSDFKYMNRLERNYHFTAGISSGGKFSGHAPLLTLLGAIIGIAKLGGGDLGEWGGVKFFLLFPEGLGYRIFLNDRLDIIPFCNPLGLDFGELDNSGDLANLTDDVGIRLNYMLDDEKFISFHLGRKFIYNSPVRGFQIGFCYGISRQR